uniref:C-factor-like n=1 Tax=Pelusios castaneus TaxID=367368 RepID=A0A8C8SQ73_9SAUR
MAGLNIRSVLVTGSNRGIGLELVKQLVGKSNPPRWVFATCRNPEGTRGQELRELVSKHANLVMVKLDAVNPVSIQEAAKTVEAQLEDSGLNLLINNAGIFSNVTLETVDAEEMLGAYKTNVVGPMLVGQAFLPLLKKAAQTSAQKGLSCSKAAIVNISSVLGSVALVPETFFKPVISYRCSKAVPLTLGTSSLHHRAAISACSHPRGAAHSVLFPGARQLLLWRKEHSHGLLSQAVRPQAALNMLTRSQALSYMKDGILCAALHPGWVQTDMGTREADLTVEESIRGILTVLSALSEKHSGSFLNWAGKTLPW